jgi:hypothetical protein
LLFVHGTGVRAAGYAATLRLIEGRVAQQRLSVSVRGCFWGEAEGARLRVGGSSIPGYGDTGGHAPTYEDELMALWSVLYTDPWYELRVLRHLPPPTLLPGQESPAGKLRRTIEQLEPPPELAVALSDAGLANLFGPAVSALRAAPEFDQALTTAPSDPLDHRRAIARAVIAHALVAADDQGLPPPDGATRDRCVEMLSNQLHGYGLGVSDFLTRPFKGMAARMVTRKLTGDRGAISDATGPVAGDILRFLARGDGVREFITDHISDAGPTYLLGHSLGGIMCVDLLIRERIPDVLGLITVGSQAPFLYEIGALPALMPPDPLPEHFPRWLNVYDRRDVLSYLCTEVFTGDVCDVELDNRQPFPQSHSAYWTNDALWDAIGGFVE